MKLKHFLKLTPLLGLVFLLLAACSHDEGKAGADNGVAYYTCTMHPSVKSKVPGKCPICSMDLVPVMKKEAHAATNAADHVHSHSPDMAAETSLVEQPSEFTVPVARQQMI